MSLGPWFHADQLLLDSKFSQPLSQAKFCFSINENLVHFTLSKLILFSHRGSFEMAKTFEAFVINYCNYCMISSRQNESTPFLKVKSEICFIN